VLQSCSWDKAFYLAIETICYRYHKLKRRAPNPCGVINMELVLCHLSGVRNFEVAHRFFLKQKLCYLALDSIFVVVCAPTTAVSDTPQTVRYRIYTARDRLRSQVILCRICGRKNWNWNRIPPPPPAVFKPISYQKYGRRTDKTQLYLLQIQAVHLAFNK